jgi:predicted nuclease with TOPRIM domain
VRSKLHATAKDLKEQKVTLPDGTEEKTVVPKATIKELRELQQLCEAARDQLTVAHRVNRGDLKERIQRCDAYLAKIRARNDRQTASLIASSRLKIAQSEVAQLAEAPEDKKKKETKLPKPRVLEY